MVMLVVQRPWETAQYKPICAGILVVVIALIGSQKSLDKLSGISCSIVRGQKRGMHGAWATVGLR